MIISDVRIRLVEDAGKLLAIASMTIDECFVVHDIKILQGMNGFFVTMPSRKTADGKYKDIAHPLNTETRELIRQTVIDAFETARAEEEAKNS